MESVDERSKPREGWVRVFCPHTRSLSAEEIASLPPDERKKAEAGDEGMWLEVQCPEEKCLIGDHKVTIEVRGVKAKEAEGLWHRLFCPEDRCLAESATDIP